MKGLMKVFSDGSGMWRDWRMTGLLIYAGECVGRHLVGRLQKRWIDTVKDCLKKICLDVRQARRMVNDRSVWWRFVMGKCMGHHPGDEPFILMRCHSCELPFKLYGPLEGWKSVCSQAHNLRE